MKIQDIRDAMERIAGEFDELGQDVRDQLMDKTLLSSEDRADFMETVARCRRAGVIKDAKAAQLCYVIEHWERQDLADRMRFFVELVSLERRESLSAHGLPLERQEQMTRGAADTVKAATAYADRSLRRVLLAAGKGLQNLAIPGTEGLPEADTNQPEPDPLDTDELGQRVRAGSRLVATAWQEFRKARKDLAEERRSKHPDAM